MIEKHIMRKYHDITFRFFSGITDFVKYTDNAKIGNLYKKARNVRISRLSGYDNFYGTGTYEEARNLFLHGWEEGAQKIKKALKPMSSYKEKVVASYGVQGYAPCVPRYLYGLPDSMITHKTVREKQKVLKLYKCMSYSCEVSAEQILSESAKILNAVQQIEASNVRTDLNVIFQTTNRMQTVYSAYAICVKKPDQRLNLKQTVFPLMHPGMQRRINFDYIEKAPELNRQDIVKNYGYSVNDTKIIKDALKGSYYFPAIIEEDEITNIEKYKL